MENPTDNSEHNVSEAGEASRQRPNEQPENIGNQQAGAVSLLQPNNRDEHVQVANQASVAHNQSNLQMNSTQADGIIGLLERQLLEERPPCLRPQLELQGQDRFLPPVNLYNLGTSNEDRQLRNRVLNEIHTGNKCVSCNTLLKTAPLFYTDICVSCRGQICHDCTRLRHICAGNPS